MKLAVCMVLDDGIIVMHIVSQMTVYAHYQMAVYSRVQSQVTVSVSDECVQSVYSHA